MFNHCLPPLRHLDSLEASSHRRRKDRSHRARGDLLRSARPEADTRIAAIAPPAQLGHGQTERATSFRAGAPLTFCARAKDPDAARSVSPLPAASGSARSGSGPGEPSPPRRMSEGAGQGDRCGQPGRRRPAAPARPDFRAAAIPARKPCTKRARRCAGSGRIRGRWPSRSTTSAMSPMPRATWHGPRPSIRRRSRCGERPAIRAVPPRPTTTSGEVARNRGDLASAANLFHQSLALYGSAGNKSARGLALYHVGDVSPARGGPERAEPLFAEALTLRREIGGQRGDVECLEGLAGVAAARAWRERAIPLFWAAESLRGGIGAPIPPAMGGPREQTLSELRQPLGHAEFAAIWADGAALLLDEAMGEAMRHPGIRREGTARLRQILWRRYRMPRI